MCKTTFINTQKKKKKKKKKKKHLSLNKYFFLNIPIEIMYHKHGIQIYLIAVKNVKAYRFC